MSYLEHGKNGTDLYVVVGSGKQVSVTTQLNVVHRVAGHGVR